MQDLKPTSFGKTLVLLKSQPLPGQIKSLLHANRLALNHLGHGTASSSDEKGGVLRRIRLDRGIDPALLATEACISLAQLYAIESGEEGLFYSAHLREQTARRVASLLQADWNNLSAQHLTIKSFSNVFHLPRAAAMINSGTPINTAAMFQKHDAVEGSDRATESFNTGAQTQEVEAVSPQTTILTTLSPAPQRGKNWLWLALILAAYALAVFVTLGLDALSIARNAWDAGLALWEQWIRR
jgi:hypothetical protein